VYVLVKSLCHIASETLDLRSFAALLYCTKLYGLVTEEGVRERLVQGTQIPDSRIFPIAERVRFEFVTCRSAVRCFNSGLPQSTEPHNAVPFPTFQSDFCHYQAL